VLSILLQTDGTSLLLGRELPLQKCASDIFSTNVGNPTERFFRNGIERTLLLRELVVLRMLRWVSGRRSSCALQYCDASYAGIMPHNT
jgi:hypothetical protein